MTHLTAGEPAPFDGFLLSGRALIILYRDASKQTTEQAMDGLRLRLEPKEDTQ